MDFKRIDGITPAARVKGIGSEQSRRNRDQQHPEDEQQEDSAEQQAAQDRVSIASLSAAEDLLPAGRYVRVEDDDAESPDEHPHIDTTA